MPVLSHTCLYRLPVGHASRINLRPRSLRDRHQSRVVGLYIPCQGDEHCASCMTDSTHRHPSPATYSRGAQSQKPLRQRRERRLERNDPYFLIQPVQGQERAFAFEARSTTNCAAANVAGVLAPVSSLFSVCIALAACSFSA